MKTYFLWNNKTLSEDKIDLLIKAKSFPNADLSSKFIKSAQGKKILSPHLHAQRLSLYQMRLISFLQKFKEFLAPCYILYYTLHLLWGIYYVPVYK